MFEDIDLRGAIGICIIALMGIVSVVLLIRITISEIDRSAEKSVRPGVEDEV